jgi:thiol-disulfide isomerase/thioredoxin
MTEVAQDDRPAPPTSPRRRSKGPLWASGLAVVVLAIATIVAFSFDDEPRSISPNDPTQLQGRDVTGEAVSADVFDRFDGGELTGTGGSLADYAGRPLVVNFFASWCTPCIKEMPAFEDVHQQLGDAVAFVGINTGEQLESGTRIIRQTGVTYDVLRDPTGALTQRYDVLNMPTTLFVDRDGTIVRAHTGELSESELQQIVRDDLLT